MSRENEVVEMMHFPATYWLTKMHVDEVRTIPKKAKLGSLKVIACNLNKADAGKWRFYTESGVNKVTRVKLGTMIKVKGTHYERRY